MRSFRATNNQMAVSANTKETDINTESTPDTTMQVGVSDVINLERRTENDAEELNGNEEASTVYHNGMTASGSINFEKAQPQHVAFLAAYGLGTVSTSAAGTGYEHTITPISGDEDNLRSNPSFSLAMKLGETVLKRLFYSMFVNSFTLTFPADGWVSASAELVGTGKTSDNIVEEDITASDDATSLTLAANAVYGATAAARVDSIHEIRAELTSGVWTDVTFSAVSDATPAVITIEAPGSATTDITYKVLYRPAESASWMTFPAKVEESPMRVSSTTLNFGGSWGGSSFTGGKTMTCSIKNVEWSFNNNGNVEFCFGTAGDYGGRFFRDARTQTLNVTRELRDMVMQQRLAGEETFGMRITFTGAEFDSGENYTVDVIFPKLAFLSAPLSVDGKRLSEGGELTVLEHDTYGSVIVKVKNEVDTYAA